MNDIYPLARAIVWSGMIFTLLLVVGSLLAPPAVRPADLLAAGSRALDRGVPREAAADFAQALGASLRAGAPAGDLLDLRVTLAGAYLEAGEFREAEAALKEARKFATTGMSRAEVLNAWSVLQLRLGRLSAAEADLQEARQILLTLSRPEEGAADLLSTVLHNLAALELRTGRYPEALDHEQTAISGWQKSRAPDPRLLIRGWASLSSLEYMLGRPGPARIAIERALAWAERTYGPTHPLIADLLVSDAVVLEKLKCKKEAHQALERAKRIRGASPNAAASEPLTRDVREVTTTPDLVYLRLR